MEPTMTDDETRRHRVRSAIVISGASVLWSTAVGVIAVAAGVLADSLALLTFGLGSVIDALASIVLVGRFGVEQRAPHHGERFEEIAHRAIGVALLLTAFYVAIQAISHLLRETRPEHNALGLGVAAASVVVLPVLAFAKLRLARMLSSQALRGDGILTAMGAALAATALLGLLLSDLFGWWWADAIAALVIAAMLGREGALVFLPNRGSS
jgi:divalent metal cation (Fe/Co/Zn/Cd) transporter